MALIQRRNFLIGCASLLAAPAIVRVQNIMPVKAIPFDASGLMFGARAHTGSFRYVHVFDKVTGEALAMYDYGSDVIMRDGDTFAIQTEIDKTIFMHDERRKEGSGKIFQLTKTPELRWSSGFQMANLKERTE